MIRRVLTNFDEVDPLGTFPDEESESKTSGLVLWELTMCSDPLPVAHFAKGERCIKRPNLKFTQKHGSSPGPRTPKRTQCNGLDRQQGIVSEVHMAGLKGPLEYERAVNLLTQRHSLHW
jgi:hypothetical protein